MLTGSAAFGLAARRRYMRDASTGAECWKATIFAACAPGAAKSRFVSAGQSRSNPALTWQPPSAAPLTGPRGTTPLNCHHQNQRDILLSTVEPASCQGACKCRRATRPGAHAQPNCQTTGRSTSTGYRNTHSGAAEARHPAPCGRAPHLVCQHQQNRRQNRHPAAGIDVLA